jgi:hypothetical protein
MQYGKWSIAIALIFTAMVATAQNNSTKQANKDLKKSIQDIGNLFKKNKPDSTKAVTAKTVSTAVDPGKAGSVDAAAKIIDADQLTVFNNGAAVILKGSSCAMIDASGNYIIPYNTYGNLINNAGVNQYTILMNGIIRYRTTDQQEWGYVNTKGKVIGRGVMNELTNNKRLLKFNTSGTYTYTTADGKTYTQPQPLEDINEGIGIVSKTVDNGNRILYGYKKLTGEWVSIPVFDEAYQFADGLAKVGKKNEFGEMKYGFINSTGKLVIPLNFSIKPEDFTAGFARVQPKDKTAFEYAFINRSGEIVFKQTTADIARNGSFDRFTLYGLAFNFKNVMDTTFKITAKKDFFASFGINEDAWWVQEQQSMENESNPKLYFSVRSMRSPCTTYPLLGFINLKQKTVVMPVFDMLNQDALYFDPVSHLAYAKTCAGKDNQGTPKYREGYINEAGIFVMLKGERSKW